MRFPGSPVRSKALLRTLVIGLAVFSVQYSAFRIGVHFGYQGAEVPFLPVAGTAFAAALLFALLIGLWVQAVQNVGRKANAIADERTRSLRASEDRIRNIIDTALEGILTVDSRGTITEWNTRAERIFGWRKEEAVGFLSVSAILPEQWNDGFPTEMLGQRVEATGLHWSGLKFRIEMAISRLKSPDFEGYSIFIQDITERKRAEERLRANEKLFRSIIDSAPVLVLVKNLDEEGTYRLVNQKVAEIVGMSRDEVIGKTDFDIFPPNTAKEIVARDRELISRGGRTVQDVCYNLPDGERTCLVVKSVLEDEYGVPYGICSVAIETTEQKRAERLLKDQESKMVASARLSSLGEMAGGIAHEINNPLAIIDVNASQLKRHLESADFDNKEKSIEKVQTIRQTVQRISRIIKGLRAFSRNGENDPFQPASIPALVQNTLALCAEKFRSHGIELRLGELPELTIECRETQVSQVLLNLLNNAHDAIERQAEKWIQIEVADSGEWVTMLITDSGPGIPSIVAEKIMQPFFTTKEVGKGTGLGLSVSKGIIEDHGGTISLDRLCVNTQFVLRLPKRQPRTDAGRKSA